MYRLATKHSVTDRQTDRQSERVIITVAVIVMHGVSNCCDKRHPYHTASWNPPGHI